jgi:hypothetical protein
MFDLDTEQERYCNFKSELEVQGKTEVIYAHNMVGAAVTPSTLLLNLTFETDIG